MAIAAAMEMARTAGYAFNPLLIHSPIGLGKAIFSKESTLASNSIIRDCRSFS